MPMLSIYFFFQGHVQINLFKMTRVHSNIQATRPFGYAGMNMLLRNCFEVCPNMSNKSVIGALTLKFIVISKARDPFEVCTI